jgi:hypothetical protein
MTQIEKLAVASITLLTVHAEHILESLPLPPVAIPFLHAGLEVAVVATTSTLAVKFAALIAKRTITAPGAKTTAPAQSQTPTSTVALQTTPVALTPTHTVAASQPAPEQSAVDKAIKAMGVSG